MSNVGCLLSMLNMFIHLAYKYRRICNDTDPTRKANTMYFGIYAIIMSIVSAGLFLLCTWGIMALNASLDSAGLGVILMFVFMFILGLLDLVLFAQFVFGGIMGVIYQFRCNRRLISWIALVVVILTIVGMVLGLVLVIDATGLKL